ncbi:MAG: DUF3617 family protein [Burkholderiales bacterium]|nr:DUF3617 family protein [Burkholderiales bacterium]
MLMQALRIWLASRRLLICGALASGFAIPAAVATAQELPAFRKGMWEFNRTIDDGGGAAKSVTLKKCTSPTDDMRRQNDALAKAGCTFSPATRSGSPYTFTARCNVQGASVQSRSVISVESDSAYTVDVESQQGGRASKERLVARRIGDC